MKTNANRRGVTNLALLAAVLVAAGAPQAQAQTTTFDGFTPGSVHYQGTGGTTTTPGGYVVPDPYGSLWTVADEWGSMGTFDEAVVDDGTGNMVWRLSNALASTGYSNQPFTPSAPQPAGESTAALYNDRGDDHTSPLNPPNPRATAATPSFHGAFSFKSATGATQTGLSVTMSPMPRQSNFRMSYLRIDDTGSGFDLVFYDTLVAGAFPPSGTIVASGISYADWHQVDMYVKFADGLNPDGSGNDLVHVLLDGNLVHTATTWETYYAANPGSFPSPIAVDSMTFRVSSAAPGTSGNGLFFDDVAFDNVPAPASVYPVQNVTQNTGHLTIQAAIDAATAGDTIEVAAGSYPENLVINKALILEGANAGVAFGSRVGESIIAPATGLPVSISSDGVTLNGFEITAPSHTNAINCGNTSDLTIQFNRVHDVGTDLTTGNVHAILYTVANSPAATSSVTVADNLIENIASVDLTGSSASAIGFLHSPSTGVLTGLAIERNNISNVAVNTGNWPTGKIAYGVIVNVAGGSGFASSTGKVVNLSIQDNNISNLSGFIATGIGLEGNTENATVTGNVVSNLSGRKLADRAGGGYDLSAVKIENNRFAGSITISNNSLQVETFTHDGTPGLGYAISNYVDASLHGTPTANNNWLGNDDLAAILGDQDIEGTVFTKVGGEVEFDAWYIDAALTHLVSGETWVDDDFTAATPGWGTTHFDNIEDAIAHTTAAGTVNVAAGTYTENLTIDKQVSIVGAGSGAVTLDASGGTPGILLQAGGAAAGDRMVISGISITGSTGDGIRAYKAGGLNLDHVTLDDVTITGSGAKAVELHNDTVVTDLVISDCEFTGNTSNGLRSASNVILDGLTIIDSDLSNNSYGIYLQGTISNVLLQDSHFDNSSSYGAYMTETGPLTGLTVDTCTFDNNVVGMMVWNEQDNADISITGSSFQGNDKWGALIWGNSLENVSITDSTFASNDGLASGYFDIDFSTYLEDMTNVSVNECSILGATGLKNRNTPGSTEAVDATRNYWGSASPDFGTALVGDVSYLPYYTDFVGGNLYYPVRNTTQGTGSLTIQPLLTAANPGDTIEVDAGTYAETLSVNTAVSLLGPNAGIDAITGTRSAEAVIEGQITVASDDVTIDGLEITNPSSTIGVYTNGYGGLTVSNNIIHDINSAGTGSATGVYVKEGASPVQDFVITGNYVHDIGSLASTVSTKGIFFGDSNGSSVVSNILIQNNKVETVATTRGAYGITLNYGVYGSPAGSADNVQILDNIVTDLEGLWVHGIGLETTTTNTVVQGNDISDLRDNKSPSDAVGIFFEGNPAGASVTLDRNILRSDMGWGVAVHPDDITAYGYTVDASANYWDAPDGPSGEATGSGTRVAPNATYSPWYADEACTILVDETNFDDFTIPEPDSVTETDLYIGSGATGTVYGSLTVTGALTLADGATLDVIGGQLNLGDGTVIEGDFLIFNSFGSWNINGNTTFTIGQSLALITDIHVAAGATLTVNGGGELVLDGCVIDSQTPGSTYNITVDADGLLTVARCVVTDAIIDINTSAGSVGANLSSRIYDSRFVTCDVEATADAAVYHNLFDATTDSDSNTDGTTAFDPVDGWANVTDPANLQNLFTLAFDAPADATRTLDSDGNLFVQTGDAVVISVDVGDLSPHTITGAEALLGYHAGYINLDPGPPSDAVTPAAGWQMVIDDDSIDGSLGLIDSAIGLTLSGPGDDGISGPANVAKVDYLAAADGLTMGFFRVQTNRQFNPDGSLVKDTRLIKSELGLPSYLSAFTANTGELVIDTEVPSIDASSVDGTQLQPTLGTVDVLDPAPAAPPAFTYRSGSEPLVLTFTATDTGLAGLDAADATNDLALVATNGTTTLDSSNYTVTAVEAAGVLTYTVDLDIPDTATNGTYAVAATVLDRSGNQSASADLGEFKIANELIATVELEGLVAGPLNRDVTFVATDAGGTALATWPKSIEFTGGVGSIGLEDVPSGTTNLSAKTDWNLRSKVAGTLSTEGVGSADFTGADLLPGGDITGDNVANLLDYSVLRYHWSTADPTADINGDGGVLTGDYNILRANFYTIGDPQ